MAKDTLFVKLAHQQPMKAHQGDGLRSGGEPDRARRDKLPPDYPAVRRYAGATSYTVST